MEQSIIEKIKSVLKNNFNIDYADDLSESTSLRDDLGLDSMSTLTFLMSLEDNISGFSIDANTLEGHHVQTIGSLCQYVTESLEAVG